MTKASMTALYDNEDRNAVLYLMRQFEEPAPRDVDIIVWSVSMVIGALAVPIFG